MEPVSAETIVLPQKDGSEEVAQKVLEASRNNFAVEWAKYKAESKTTEETKPVIKPGKATKQNLNTEPKALEV